jgi:cyclic pyranopterin phosphate synthase
LKQEKKNPVPTKGALALMEQGTFCPIPFLQLEFTPLGDVSACCFSGEYKVGSVNETKSIKDIWNSEVMQQWRREFLTGDIRICESAIKNFACQKHYQHLNSLVDFSEVQTQMPQRLDLRLNGKCNLECVMCDVWYQPNGRYDASEFWEIGPTEIYPYLKEVDMLGGEPFIQKDTFRFIQDVSSVNKDCTWGFITNCHYRLSKQLREALNSLKIRHIHMSLDAVTADTYAKVRLKGNWDIVLPTVEAYIQMRDERAKEGRGFLLFASMCVQKDNWFEVPDFIKFCEARNIVPLIQGVIGREHLSLTKLSPEQKSELKRLYTTKLSENWQKQVAFLHESL